MSPTVPYCTVGLSGLEADRAGGGKHQRETKRELYGVGANRGGGGSGDHRPGE